MPKEAILLLVVIFLLSVVLLIPLAMELRTRKRIAKELGTLGGEVLEVRRVVDEQHLIEVPSGALYEVNYLNRWGRKGRRRCRAAWFGKVEWLRTR